MSSTTTVKVSSRTGRPCPVAGVPMVCLPMGRDQNDTAARIVHRGAGVRLSPRASANKIRAAVERVLTDPSYLQKARDLGRAISDGEGCVDMIDAIERLAGQRRAPQAPAA